MTVPTRELHTEDNLHYVKFGNQDTYVLANKGITDWTASMNANTDDGVQYIGESSQESQILGYSPSVDYSATAYPSDPFSQWIYEIGKLEKVGETFEEVEVETWNVVDESAGTYHAYHHTYEVQPDNPGSGEGGGKLSMVGTFAQKGAVVEGTFAISTKTFTETTTTSDTTTTSA